MSNGLGVFVEKDEEATMFSHNGYNIGYLCMYIGNDKGQGAVVITNSEFGDHLIEEIIPSIAKVYGWSGKTSLAKMFSPAVSPKEMSSAEETRKIDPKKWVKDFSGEYLFEDHTVKVYEDSGKIFTQLDADPPFEVQPLTKSIACYHPSDPGPWYVIKFETAEDGSKNFILFGIEYKRRV